jgi:hypothetical protein
MCASVKNCRFSIRLLHSTFGFFFFYYLKMSDDDCNGELSAAKPQNWYAIDNNKTEITNFHAC